MNGQRNIRPVAPDSSEEHTLKSITPRHLELLRRARSPLMHIAEIMQRGTDGTTQAFEDFLAQYLHNDIRPTMLILITIAEDLHILEALSLEELTQAADDLIARNEHPGQNALAWQLLAMHLGAALERFKNIETGKN